jgi:hypothetical protein
MQLKFTYQTNIVEDVSKGPCIHTIQDFEIYGNIFIKVIKVNIREQHIKS